MQKINITISPKKTNKNKKNGKQQGKNMSEENEQKRKNT